MLIQVIQSMLSRGEKTADRYRVTSQSKRRKKTLYARLCGWTSRSKKKALAMDADADAAFWATFYRAYDALCTPVILGEIEAETLDVKIVYANTAACEFTGYSAGEMSPLNPNGLVGRSVTELMEDSLADVHAGFVERWLARRGVVSSHSTTGNFSSFRKSQSAAVSSANPDDDLDNDDKMRAVEGISRRVVMVTIDGRSLTTDAALSFFTAKGLNKVIGIFSFKSAEDLNVVSFKGMTFNLQYRPDKKSKTGYYVVVEPPASLSDFSDDDAWKITAVSSGIVLKSGDLKAIKELIRKEIFRHLSKISCGSGLDITYVEKDSHAVNSRDMRKAHSVIMYSINESKTQENMHMSVERRQDSLEALASFEHLEEEGE